MKRKNGSVRSAFLGLLGLSALMASCFMPFLSAFTTATGYGDLRGALEVGNAFGFIFGTEVQTQITLGVGNATTNLAGPASSFEPPLYPLLGYIFILASSVFALAALIFVFSRSKNASILFAFFSSATAVCGAVFLLMSKEAIAATFFGVSLEEAKTIVSNVGMKLGPGMLWCAIPAFIAAPLTFGSALLLPSKN